MSPLLVGALIIVGTVVLTVTAQLLVRRFVPHDLLAAAQASVGDVFIPATSALYGVLVAFLLADALNDYAELRSTIAVEFNAMINLARVAQHVPGPDGDALRRATVAYARSVAQDEWPHLAEGEPVPRTTEALDRLWRTVSTTSPATAGGANLHAQALDIVTTIATQRRLRLLAVQRTMPAVVWWILAGGAAVVIGYATFATIPSEPLQLAFTIGLAIVVALSLYAMYALSNPVQSGLELERIGSALVERMR